jgi:trk system potassium uptake protein TrkA
MRAVFIGASHTTQATARMLLHRGHEVVIVERDKDKIDSVVPELDCGYLHGDGSKPAVLRDADPEHTDLLYCLTENDQANVLASLVGRTLGFRRVVCKIQDPELIHLCVELGLEDVIIPSQAVGRQLAGMFEGHDPWEISAKIRGDARMFSFVLKEGDEAPVHELELPPRTRIVCYYRDDRFCLPVDDTGLEAGDEVVVVTDGDNLDSLVRRWSPPAAGPQHMPSTPSGPPEDERSDGRR